MKCSSSLVFLVSCCFTQDRIRLKLWTFDWMLCTFHQHVYIQTNAGAHNALNTIQTHTPRRRCMSSSGVQCDVLTVVTSVDRDDVTLYAGSLPVGDVDTATAAVVVATSLSFLQVTQLELLTTWFVDFVEPVGNDVPLSTVVIATVVWDSDATLWLVVEWSRVVDAVEQALSSSSSSLADCRAVTPSGQQPYNEWTHDASSPEDICCSSPLLQSASASPPVQQIPALSRHVNNTEAAVS